MCASGLDSGPKQNRRSIGLKGNVPRAISRAEAAAHTPTREICHGAISGEEM